MSASNFLVDEQFNVEVSDVVKHPSHYTSGNIEVWDFIIDQKLNYCLGNAIKYITRAGKKNQDTYVEDLKKAIQYLEKELSVYEKKVDDTKLKYNNFF